MMMGKRTGFEDDGIFYERREYDTKSTWQMMELERIIEDPSAILCPASRRLSIASSKAEFSLAISEGT
jgi:hypothetical protein